MSRLDAATGNQLTSLLLNQESLSHDIWILCFDLVAVKCEIDLILQLAYYCAISDLGVF